MIGFVIDVEWPNEGQEFQPKLTRVMSLVDVLAWIKKTSETHPHDRAWRELVGEFLDTTLAELHHKQQWATTLRSGTIIHIECLLPEARKPFNLENLEGILK